MKFVQKFKEREEIRKRLLAKLIIEYKRPIKDGDFSHAPTEEDVTAYYKKIRRKSLKQLRAMDGFKIKKLRLDVGDRLKSIRKKKYAVVTIFNDNKTTDTGVCHVYNRSFTRSKMRYLIMPERGIYDPEFKMLHFYYFANHPFPIVYQKGELPEDTPDGKLLDSTIEMSVIEALANLDMSSLIKICLVASILNFIVCAFLLILQLRGGL